MQRAVGAVNDMVARSACRDESRHDTLRRAPLLVLRLYKRWISPLLPSACRFHPTCSEYMMRAIEKHGVVRGVSMGLRRLGRCHPFCEGGFDPVR